MPLLETPYLSENRKMKRQNVENELQASNETKDFTKGNAHGLHYFIGPLGIKTPSPAKTDEKPDVMTREELYAVTRGELLYEAAAAILIRKGRWVIIEGAVS